MITSPIDINSTTFNDDFDLSKATVGQVGYGFIGNAVVELFRDHVGKILIYDKAKVPTKFGNLELCASLDPVVASAEVIFVAVPTPMKPSGECHTGIVESVLQDIQNAALKMARQLENFVVVLKSTVPPGFTRRMQDKYALRLVFSPEFLTEAHAVKDFRTTNRVLMGGDLEDALVLKKYFEGVWPDRLIGTYVDHKDGPVALIHCEPGEAEMVKLSTNIHLTSKVMVSNELYLICQKLGIDYDNVRIMTQLDRRIGLSHMNVPGPDGLRGVSGSCFPKDLNSLAFLSEQLECSTPRQCGASGCVPGETSLFREMFERNVIIRGQKDWEQLTGRAIVDSDAGEKGIKSKD